MTKYAIFVVIAAVVFMVLFSTPENTAKFMAASRMRGGAITSPQPPVQANPLKPDLTPVAVKFNDGVASNPPMVSTTTVSVKNKGAGSASNVEVLIKDAFNNNLGTCTISSINAGETKSCDANYPYVYAPNYEHVYVDPNKKIAETDETNNELQVNL